MGFSGRRLTVMASVVRIQAKFGPSTKAIKKFWDDSIEEAKIVDELLKDLIFVKF